MIRRFIYNYRYIIRFVASFAIPILLTTSVSSIFIEIDEAMKNFIVIGCLSLIFYFMYFVGSVPRKESLFLLKHTIIGQIIKIEKFNIEVEILEVKKGKVSRTDAKEFAKKIGLNDNETEQFIDILCYWSEYFVVAKRNNDIVSLPVSLLPEKFGKSA